mgnify:CR=1 FL=1
MKLSIVIPAYNEEESITETIDQIEEFLNTNSPDVYKKVNQELMHELLKDGIASFDTMLERYRPYLNRELNEINLIEQIILVVAATELINSLNVPAPVIINEAVELAKLYGAEESHKFINGLVDKLAKETRQEEIKQYSK